MTLPADCHDTVLSVSSQVNQLEADYNKGGFMVIWKAQMAVSSTGDYLG